MRRMKSSPTRQPPERAQKWVKPVSAGSSLPYYGCWASSVDYIKSLQTLSDRLKSMDMPNVAESYSKAMVAEGCMPTNYFDKVIKVRNQSDLKEAKESVMLNTEAITQLTNALASNIPIKGQQTETRKTPRSPYESPEHSRSGHFATPRLSHHLQSPKHSAEKCLRSPSSRAAKDIESVATETTLPDVNGSPVYQLEDDPPTRGFSAKSGSSDLSYNFSASECSMYYSPSRFSGISSSGVSSSANHSVASSSTLPSVCMMAEYSAANYQNRILGTTSRLRGIRNTDNALEKSSKEIFIEKNGAGRSCLLASQSKHSNLRSACPKGTVVAQDDLAKYKRLRNCNPNVASRELGFAFHTTLFVQAAMRKQHGE